MADNSDNFILILHAFPIYCRKKSDKEFKTWFKEMKPILQSMRGTVKEVNEQIEELVR